MEYVPLVKQVPKTQVREVQKQAGAGAERGERFFLVPSRKQSFLFFFRKYIIVACFLFVSGWGSTLPSARACGGGWLGTFEVISQRTWPMKFVFL